jgi:hypothetical protein
MVSGLYSAGGLSLCAVAKASKAAPWLAGIVGWLVPIVWVIWGIGLVVGLFLALIAQWGASRFIGSLSLKPAFPR